jgi:purine nucleosidase
VKIHVDTDFGGDPDDAAALVMLLGWPEVDLVGITTNLDDGGRRAGCAAYYLRVAGREGLPVAAGASRTLTGRSYACSWGDDRYWPDPVEPWRSPAGAALDLLASSVEDGATILAIGALTNLALLETMRPGALNHAPVVVMGGWLDTPPAGLPQWGPDMDFNVQADTRATEIVLTSAADITLVPLPVAITATLRGADLPALEASGPLGALVARQSFVHAADTRMDELAACHDGLPADLVNFHWDPVAAAVAVGWSGITTTEQRLAVVHDEGPWRLEPSTAGRVMNIATALDADAFRAVWRRAVGAADAHARGST